MSNLSDIERQAKTIDQLMTRCEVLDGAWTTANAHREALTLDIDALKAKVERLREALEKILEYDKYFVLWNHEKAMHDIACAALEVTK